VRQQIQNNVFIVVFTQAWLYPKVDPKAVEQKSMIDDALQISKSFFRDVAEKISSENTTQKIFNKVFSLLVDAYIERFIIAASISLKLKCFKPPP